MAVPSNPGWKSGYVPSAGEWNNTFAGKADYPVSASQGGTGGQDAYTGNYNLQQRNLVTANVAILPLTMYGVRTNLGAFILTLPPLLSVNVGDWIYVADIDFNAASNPITVMPASPDQIALYGTAEASQQINIAGGQCWFFADTPSIWSMSS